MSTASRPSTRTCRRPPDHIPHPVPRIQSDLRRRGRPARAAGAMDTPTSPLDRIRSGGDRRTIVDCGAHPAGNPPLDGNAPAAHRAARVHGALRMRGRARRLPGQRCDRTPRSARHLRLRLRSTMSGLTVTLVPWRGRSLPRVGALVRPRASFRVFRPLDRSSFRSPPASRYIGHAAEDHGVRLVKPSSLSRQRSSNGGGIRWQLQLLISSPP